MATKDLKQGLESNVTRLFWRAGKIDRVCRSPAAAETIAALDGEDDLLYMRNLWSERCGKPMDPKNPDQGACQTPGHLVTDAKNLFDKLRSPVMTMKGSEKRFSVEALSLQENMERAGTTMSWVHGDAMIANSLTKPTEKHQFMLYLHMGSRWKILYDKQMMSAKTCLSGQRSYGRG